VKWDRFLPLAFWSPPLRVVLFVATFLGAYAVAQHLPIISVQSNSALVSQVLAEVARSDIENVAARISPTPLPARSCGWLRASRSPI
jgi:hypothetical protein